MQDFYPVRAFVNKIACGHFEKEPFKTKERSFSEPLFSLCPGGDLNSYRETPASPSSLCVYQFHHLGVVPESVYLSIRRSFYVNNIAKKKFRKSGKFFALSRSDNAKAGPKLLEVTYFHRIAVCKGTAHIAIQNTHPSFFTICPLFPAVPQRMKLFSSHVRFVHTPVPVKTPRGHVPAHIV